MSMAAVAFSVLLLLNSSLGARSTASPQPPEQEVQVWAISASKVYHCPRSRWDGVGEGKYMSECQALREGFRPAFGRGCSSRCK
jgi:hypothetical protein